jgi:hypothetical protein
MLDPENCAEWKEGIHVPYTNRWSEIFKLLWFENVNYGKTIEVTKT